MSRQWSRDRNPSAPQIKCVLGLGAEGTPNPKEKVRCFQDVQHLNYEFCKIGQLSRCNETGCEWKKIFGGYCWLRPTQKECNFRKSKEKIEVKNIKPNFVFVKEEPNEFKTAKQDEWIKKIKVKL